jgi:hypothetical protein
VGHVQDGRAEIDLDALEFDPEWAALTDSARTEAATAARVALVWSMRCLPV